MCAQALRFLLCCCLLCCRCCRRHYFNNTDGLIFVVDSQDKDRLGRAGQEFRSIINDPLMKNSVILVFANKQVGGSSGCSCAGGCCNKEKAGLAAQAHARGCFCLCWPGGGY
jgi:hypothetical protein